MKKNEKQKVSAVFDSVESAEKYLNYHGLQRMENTSDVQIMEAAYSIRKIQLSL